MRTRKLQLVGGPRCGETVTAHRGEPVAVGLRIDLDDGTFAVYLIENRDGRPVYVYARTVIA